MTAPTYDIDDCPDLSQFADLVDVHRFGQDPALLRADLIAMIREGVDSHPRSQQREIGPSQIGHPCPRWLAYFFAEVPETGLQKTNWRAAVGTAVHDGFTDWAHAWNERHGLRYLADVRVYVGDLYPGRPITGKLDLFDLWSCTVGDLKVPGPTSMKRNAQGKPEDPQYQAQVHLYGVGAQNAGLHVRNVGILRVPSAGGLDDAIWKVVPHEPEKAATAMARAGGIARLADAMGPAAAALQPAVDHHCGHCEWFRPGATDLTQACPGAESFLASQEARQRPPASLTELAGAPTQTTPATPGSALAAI